MSSLTLQTIPVGFVPLSPYLDGVWQEFLVLMVQEVGARTVETWFKSVILQNWDITTCSVSISVPNAFVQEWLLRHYLVHTEKCLARIFNVKQVRVFFIVPGNEVCTIAPAKLVDPIADADMKSTSTVPAKTIKPALSKDMFCSALNPLYTFDSFVVGSSNELAWAAAKSVAERKHVLYNPLFIYGSSGLGKTHLLNAIGNYFSTHHPHLTVLYQSADRFVQHFIQSIRSNTIERFEQSFRNIDLLLIDDIQFISKKEQTQEAFFKIFNMLHGMRHQIVVTSDCMPRDIKGLANRIRSRFEGGLIVDVHLPPFETMVAILHRKAELYNIVIGSDVAHYLVSQIATSVRELEGVLIRLAAYTTLAKQPISLATAEHIMLFRENRGRDTVELHQILSIIAVRYRVSLTLLRSDDRNQRLTRVRHVTMYLMKKLTQRSFKDIGMYLHRDHSTVVHGYEKMARQRLEDQQLDTELRNFEKDLAGDMRPPAASEKR